MSGNPIAPGSLLKGAIVAIANDGSKRSLAFQYNPDTMQRTLQPNTVGGQPGSRSRAVRFAGAPTETITLDCRFSAVDAIDAGDVGQGIAPQLAALAVLLYPKSADVIQAQSMLDDGLIEVVPALADRLLFVWGANRVLPVELTSATIVEELYDAELVPVLATVTLTLRALSYSDVDEANGSYAAFLSYQQGLEGLAQGAFSSGGAEDWE
ncbi:hypothetical protein [Solirubrobacter soli]|uniref:hypothetical protein n=1 Tax=Solirubrobacter soli TaxID=363832 RepID=UPI0003F5F523|nr:hypothetical protein [Solirubrobacter soli]